MLRVLHIVNKWAQGGVERFIEGLVEDGISGDIQQSVLSICTDISSSVQCAKYGPMCEGLGMASMLKGSRQLGRFLKGNHFDVVHIHTNNSSGYLYAKVAKKCGVSKRIIHSHNSSLGIDAGFAKRAANRIFYILCSGSETDRLACSRDAGLHLFGNSSFEVVPNGIDIDKFTYSERLRELVRNRLGIPQQSFMVGFVGSLIQVKNPKRALSIFERMLSSRPDSYLLFVGDGDLRGELEEIAQGRKIGDRVLFAGFVDDVSAFYSSMDILLAPSLYEGLPIALIEAQCNGLPVLLSDSITQEAAVTDAARFISLAKADCEWADAAFCAKRILPREAVGAIRERGYSRSATTELLHKLYSL